MFAPAFVVSFLASLSLASPAMVGRQTSVCPYNGVPDQNNFTLLAVSNTDTSVRKPLALGTDELSGSTSLAWIGDAESMGYIISKNFVLNEGGVTGFTSDDIKTSVSKDVPKENGWLSFTLVEGNTTPPSPTKGVYCELFSTDPHGVEFPDILAVNGGDSEHFSLCQRSIGDEFIVIYGAVESNSTSTGYIFETCTDVAIAVLPVGQ